MLLFTAMAAVAGPGVAQDPYAPPHMTFGPPQAPATAPAPSPQPAPAPEPYAPPHMTFAPPAPDPAGATTAVRRTGWAFALLAGRYTEPDVPEATRLGLDLEALLLADLGRWVAGGMLATGWMGLSASAVGGARLHVGPVHRIDLLADLGVGYLRYAIDEARYRPTAGVRAGFTRAGAKPGDDLTVGLAVRRRFGKDVTITDTMCSPGSSACQFHGEAGGAIIAGAFFTWGGAPDASR